MKAPLLLEPSDWECSDLRGVLPYKGLMERCGPSGYGLGGFCLEQGIDFITLSYMGYLFLANVLNRVGF